MSSGCGPTATRPGKTKSSVVLRGDLQVDLRVAPQVAFGAALHYFTGSKAHNIAVRKIGVKKDLKINEYGVFKDEEGSPTRPTAARPWKRWPNRGRREAGPRLPGRHRSLQKRDHGQRAGPR